MSNKEKQTKALALLEKRVLKFDNQLRLIGNLANKQYYFLNPHQKQESERSQKKFA